MSLKIITELFLSSKNLDFHDKIIFFIKHLENIKISRPMICISHTVINFSLTQPLHYGYGAFDGVLSFYTKEHSLKKFNMLHSPPGLCNFKDI